MNKATTALLGFGLLVGPAFGGAVTLFQPHPTCFDLAIVANHFIGLGKDGAIAELTRIWRHGKDDPPVVDMHEQIAWVCRLVFVPRPGEVVRRPLFGSQGQTLDNLRDVEWPYYPLAESEGVFFLLAEGYSSAGSLEDPIDYLSFCSANGVFRERLLEVPTERALEHLFASESWTRIVWKDGPLSGPSIGSDFADLKKYLRDQTRRKANHSLEPTPGAVH